MSSVDTSTDGEHGQQGEPPGGPTPDHDLTGRAEHHLGDQTPGHHHAGGDQTQELGYGVDDFEDGTGQPAGPVAYGVEEVDEDDTHQE
jgi:hypothetical protein